MAKGKKTLGSYLPPDMPTTRDALIASGYRGDKKGMAHRDSYSKGPIVHEKTRKHEKHHAEQHRKGAAKGDHDLPPVSHRASVAHETREHDKSVPWEQTNPDYYGR